MVLPEEQHPDKIQNILLGILLEKNYKCLRGRRNQWKYLGTILQISLPASVLFCLLALFAGLALVV